MHSHKLLTEGLVSLADDFVYLDIEFTFAGDAARKASYRLVFCSPSEDPVAAETMHSMLKDEINTLCVSVVSFADLEQLEKSYAGEDVNPFARPDNGFILKYDELNYLYSTLVDFMLRVAQNEDIQILFFSAERKELVATYSRYVKRLTKKHGLTYIRDGASYAIRTNH